MHARRLLLLLLLILALCPSCQPQAQPTSPRTETFMAPMRDGVKLCTAGKHEQGVKKLETALKDLGVKPQM